MTTILDGSRVLFIKALMGNETPKYFTKQASTSITSKESVFLSGCSALIEENEEKLKAIIKKANVFKVGRDIIKFGEKLKEYREKKANDNYAYLHNGIREIPLHDVKKASAYFDKYYMRFPFSERTKIATKIFNKAQEEGITKIGYATLIYSNPDFISNEAIDFAKAGENIAVRSTLIKNAEDSKAYLSLGNAINKGPEHTEMLKITQAVELLDRKNNLYPYHCQHGRYGVVADLADPLAEIFSSTKTAAYETQELQLGSNTYTIQDLRQVPIEIYKKTIGIELANKLASAQPKEFFDIIFNLQPMDKVILDKYIRGSRA